MYDRELLAKVVKHHTPSGELALTRRQAYDKFQGMAYPVWQRIKVKNTEVPPYQPYNNMKILYEQQEGLTVKAEVSEASSKDKAYGPSNKHRLLTETFANTGTVVEVADGIHVTTPIVIQLPMNEDNPLLLDRHVVKVGKDASVTVVYDYSDEGNEAYSNGLLEIDSKEGADVHIVKIQNMGKDSTHIHGALSEIARDSQVRYNSIDLGGALTVTDYSTYLEEENGNTLVDSIYLGEGKSKLDLGYNIYHNGRRTHSDITVKGALLDECRKVFRGNLYFARGAKRAQGAEQEYVILLDERVKADAIPALLCDEDDVQGEHAASAGQVDSDKLFYLMSRGLTEKEAKQLIIMASFAPVIEQLPIEGLKERIHETVGKKLSQHG